MKRPPKALTEDTADAIVVSGESASAVADLDRTLTGRRPLAESAAGVTAVALAGIAAFLNLYASQPLLPMLATLFGVSKAAIGMTVSASTMGVALSAPFCGALAERIGRKRIIVAA